VGQSSLEGYLVVVSTIQNDLEKPTGWLVEHTFATPLRIVLRCFFVDIILDVSAASKRIIQTFRKAG
jgi:hypothetical protein